jgi:hypothetical protein
MATLQNTTVGSTGAIQLPVGTTVQRPGSPAVGQMRYNSTFNTVEQYSSTISKWQYMTDVVRTGLVIYFDGGEPSSYPGSGTTWTNFGGSAGNGTISGSYSYTTVGGGGLTFNGTDTSVTVAYSAAMNFSAAQTICIWMRPVTGATGARRNPYNQAYGGSGTLTHEPDGSINYYFGTNGGNAEPYVGRNSLFKVAENETAFITAARNQGSNIQRWYKNGILWNQQDAGGYTATGNGSSNINIGSGYAGSFIGNIYTVMIYNVELTGAEVEQNYQAMRGRFGI